jgi:hypothetical protein
VAVVSLAVGAASLAVAVASAPVDMPFVEADTGEAEAVLAVGAGRFRHELETLAAEDIRPRPLRFRSRGLRVGVRNGVRIARICCPPCGC